MICYVFDRQLYKSCGDFGEWNCKNHDKLIYFIDRVMLSSLFVMSVNQSIINCYGLYIILIVCLRIFLVYYFYSLYFTKP